MHKDQQDEIIKLINSGKIGVMPTDTVYGIVASVRYPGSIEKAYTLTGRPSEKPLIVLISDPKQLTELGVNLKGSRLEELIDIWRSPVSVILPCDNNKLWCVHRGNNSMAVRLPNVQWLRRVIDQTGPIIATSANLSGQPTSKNIEDIKNDMPNFDFYFEGSVSDTPSRLCKLGAIKGFDWLGR